MNQYERHLRLHGAHNVRDLGGYPTACGRTTRWRAFMRADAIHALSEQDLDVLEGSGLRTVIDLRGDAEINRQPSLFAAHHTVRYHHIPLFDGLSPVDALFVAGSDFDLGARYVDAAENCRPAIARVAATIAQADDGLVLFNCTAGKDRTGIVAAMLLSLAGVSPDDIAGDYALTASLASALMTQLRMNAVARGLDEAASIRLLSSEPAAMMTFLRHMEERHGGFEAYLAGGDDGAQSIRMIRQRLVDDQDRSTL